MVECGRCRGVRWRAVQPWRPGRVQRLALWLAAWMRGSEEGSESISGKTASAVSAVSAVPLDRHWIATEAARTWG